MRREPVLGYASKREAIAALDAQGLGIRDIARQIGSTSAAVRVELRRRKRAALEAGPGIWTPEKIDKARRLFAKTMGYIAKALKVPPDELVRYVFEGEIPPMGTAGRIGALRNAAEAAGAAEAAEAGAENPPRPDSTEPLPPALPAPEAQPRPVPAARPVTPPRAVRLRDKAGRYLHQDGQHFVEETQWAWSGSPEQAAILQRRNPHLRRLVEEPAS